MAAPIAILFDMDGTLLHLRVDIDAARAALEAFFGARGFAGPFRPILARMREAALATADPRAGWPAERLVRSGFDILDRFELEAARQAEPRPGAADTIRRLSASGVRLGLVTDNGAACVPVALETVGIDPQKFAVMVTRDRLERPKPDPEGIRLAARALEPAVVRWYVGDHPKDVLAARASGLPDLRTCLVSGGLADAEAISGAGADLVLASLEAPDVLQLEER